MSKSWQLQVDLPENVRTGISHLTHELRDTLGDALKSVILYGSAVKGEYSRQFSDVNVMIVIEPIHTVVLDQIALILRQGRRNFRLAPFLISPTDLKRSCDVFPIKFLDIQQRHLLVDGEDVLETLNIERSHLRLRCEQEFRNLLLRMRHQYLQRSFYSEQFEMTLLKQFSSLLIAVDALLYLKEGQHFTHRHKIIAAATEYLSIPQEPLARLLQLRLNRWRPSKDQLKQCYEELMKVVETVANIADQMEESENTQSTQKKEQPVEASVSEEASTSAQEEGEQPGTAAPDSEADTPSEKPQSSDKKLDKSSEEGSER